MRTAREKPYPGTFARPSGSRRRTPSRIVFHEITKNAILKAVKNPRDIDMNLVNAQQARRVLDRLVGFELSPVLWRKIQPKLSAGRVQSVALRLVVDREKEIMAFQNEPYYKVEAVFHPEGHPASVKVKATLDTRFKTLRMPGRSWRTASEPVQDLRVEKKEAAPGSRRLLSLPQPSSRKLPGSFISPSE